MRQRPAPRPGRAFAAAILLITTAALLVSEAAASPEWAVERGAHAFVGADVIVSPDRTLEGATLLVRDGRVVAVGRDVPIPADARRWDVPGHVIWPAFVDPHVPLGRLAADDAPPLGGSVTGHANPLVHPEIDVADVARLDGEKAQAWRKGGFGVVRLVPDAGVLRGRGAVMTLAESDSRSRLLSRDADQHAAFERRQGEDRGYPGSLMGAIALARQVVSDARWHRLAVQHAERGNGPRPESDASLEALASLVEAERGRADRGARPARLVLQALRPLDVLRGAALAEELGLGAVLVGTGEEYRFIDAIAGLDAPLVIPIDHPDPPRAQGDDEWLEVSDRQLEHWDFAPDNPRFLEEAGARPAFTALGLDDPSDVHDRVRRSIERGLPERVALAALTTRPAALLGIDDRLGTLEAGRLANFVVSRGRPFEDGLEIRDVWLDGMRHVVSREPEGPEGTWAVTVSAGGDSIEARLRLGAHSGSLQHDATSEAAVQHLAAVSKVDLAPDTATFTLAPVEPLGTPEVAVAVRVEGGRLRGASEDGSMRLDGRRLVGPQAKDSGSGERGEADVPVDRPPPRRPGPVSPRTRWLIRGVTAWTASPEGILEDVDVLLDDGRIARVGRNLPEAGATVVAGRGLHLTPGIVDAHSHVAIEGGVNEATRSCTSEVRIRDVIDSEDVNIARQLAGGVTVANLLHGSANAMGGQNAVIKLRWGAMPDDLVAEAAAPGVKFALGENVKQSNWGEDFTTRFPQTRMGVVSFMRAKLAEALDYRRRVQSWRAGERDGVPPPRRDFQLEALLEVIDDVRDVHCHSYRQDEILMMMRVAEEFGFRLDVFQHVLEGYKVADELAAHGAAASTFSDWWAYKFEVYDAIPYNGALMAERGVNVSFNSDSAELARRLHLEAAKAVRWGGLDPHDALLFVTANPARQLGLGDVLGSIAPGMDADVVLWSGEPLSPTSRVLRTWVDGLLYFEREDMERQERERGRLRAARIERAIAQRDGKGREREDGDS